MTRSTSATHRNATTATGSGGNTGMLATVKGVCGKITILLLIFGIVPSLVIYSIVRGQTEAIEAALSTEVATTAVAINDVIDRNLFERYGDVQAFALNDAVTKPENWRRATPENPLIRAINGYMTGYGIYKLMMVLSPTGEVLAVNSVTPAGKPLDTSRLYAKTFADAPWFRNVVKGKFLDGRNGLSGTAVTQPYHDKIVAELYGSDGYVMGFSAPIKDAAGKITGIWVNFADFGLVEEIVATFYKTFADKGMTRTEITMLDPEGRVIVDFDPSSQGLKSLTDYRRNPKVIGKLNLVKIGVEAAKNAVSGKHGSMVSTHARKKIDQASGYAKSTGAYDYPGLGWSALVRIPVDEAFAMWNSLMALLLTVIIVTVGLLLAAGAAIGWTAAKPIWRLTETMNALAGGNKRVEIPSTDRSDEIGSMARTVEIFKTNMIQAEQAQQRQREAEQKQAEDERRRQEKEAEATRKRQAESFEAEQKKAEEEREAGRREAAEAERAAEEQRQRAQKVESMIDAFNSEVSEALDPVAAAATQMRASAETMTQTAEQASIQSNAVAAASEEASTNVQTVAGASEQLSASIRDIGQKSSKAPKSRATPCRKQKTPTRRCRGWRKPPRKSATWSI